VIPKGLPWVLVYLLKADGPLEVGKDTYRQGFVVLTFENHLVWEPLGSITSP
jgi:hypothetical protein